MAFGFSVASWSLITAGQSSVLVLRVVADETGGRPDFAHHADIGLIGVGLVEAVAEPVGHRIADHDDRARSAASPICAAAAPWSNRQPAPGVHRRKTETKRNRAAAAADSSPERTADRSNNRPGRPRVSTRPPRPPQSPARQRTVANSALSCIAYPNDPRPDQTSASRRKAPVPRSSRPTNGLRKDNVKLRVVPGAWTRRYGWRRRSSTSLEAKPSGTWPTEAWKSRMASRVRGPIRPSGSPIVKAAARQKLLHLVALVEREHALVARPGLHERRRRRACGRQDGRWQAHRLRRDCIS